MDAIDGIFYVLMVLVFWFIGGRVSADKWIPFAVVIYFGWGFLRRNLRNWLDKE